MRIQIFNEYQFREVMPMPKPHLEPCPFCANPAPQLRRWWSGPFLNTGYGSDLGWRVMCFHCYASAGVRYSGAPTKAGARAESIAHWNARAQVVPPSCPCCGGDDIAVEYHMDLWLDTVPHSATYHAICGTCGLTVPGLGPNHITRVGHIASNPAPCWNRRIPPGEWVNYREWEERVIQEHLKAQIIFFRRLAWWRSNARNRHQSVTIPRALRAQFRKYQIHWWTV